MNIYADHAATTKLDYAAFEAMRPFLTDEFGNPSQLYSFAREPKKAIKEARRIIASCIGAAPDEIFFTSGGTESDNWALKGLSLFRKDEKAIITSVIEHHAVLHSCAFLERIQHPVVYIPVDSNGVVSPDTLHDYISDDTHLVSIMFANNEIGTIEPIRELAEIAHKHGARFHTDAVQAVGHIPINVDELQVDMLSASAHKFNGPKGVGFLYVRNGVNLSPYFDGGSQEKGLRSGTENVAGIIGMAVALQRSCTEMEQRTKHLRELEDLLIVRLNESGLDYLRNGNRNHVPGNISVSFRNSDAEALLHRLDLMGICVSTGSACNSTSTKLSHVIKAIRVPEEYAYGTIRISLGYENTNEEIEEIVAALKIILLGLKHSFRTS